jgi:DNA-binding PucR family transcriptional regulator
MTEAVVRDPQVTDLMRQGAQMCLEILDTVVAEIHTRHLMAPGMEPIASDPVLHGASLRAIHATISTWATSFARDPWAPVDAADDPESLRMARDLVRRGLSDSIMTAYRVAQVDAWRAWIDVTTQLTDDAQVIRTVLDHTAQSIGEFNERTLQAVQAVIDQERAHLRRGDWAQRREMIELLLDGAPVPPDTASAQLGLDVRRRHTAIVVWNAQPHSDPTAVENAVERLLRDVDQRDRVVFYPSSGTAWIWLASKPAGNKAIGQALHPWPDVCVALGDAQRGTAGFRLSHRNALAVQRLIDRAGHTRVARLEDTRLAALLARHGDDAVEYSLAVLGDLAHAPPEITHTVAVYLAELGNVTATAERLYAHRNTVMRRLERANDLLPHPIAERPLDIAAALEVWQWLRQDAASSAPAH